MLPKKDEDAINIFAVGFILNVLITFTVLIIILIFHDTILKHLNNTEISPWLYFVPLAVFLTGILNLLTYFNNRIKQYRDLAKANVYKSVAGAIVQLSLGFLKAGVVGLISGQLISQATSNIKLLKNIIELDLLVKIKKLKMVALSKKYKKFFIVTTPNLLVDMAREHIFNLVISNVYSVAILGQFYLALRTLRMPFSLIGSSFSQVFLQKISVEDKTRLYDICLNFIKKVLIFIFPLFLFIHFYSESIFKLVFGPNWITAGQIVSILSPWIFLNFLTSPLSNIYIVLQKQEIIFFYGVLYAVTPFIMIMINGNDFMDMIKSLSGIMSVISIVFLLITMHRLKKLKRKA
jgi:O-antigen/teichoic acid export membrane protein